MLKTLQLFIKNHRLLILDLQDTNTVRTFESADTFIQHYKTHYQNVALNIYVDTPEASVKCLDTKGIKPWYQYKLRKRLSQEFDGHELIHLIPQKSNLIILKAKLPKFAKTILDSLSQAHIPIKMIRSSLAPILYSYTPRTSEQHVISISLSDTDTQSILLSNNRPRIIQTSLNQDLQSWVDFVADSSQTPILKWQHLQFQGPREKWTLAQKDKGYKTFALESLSKLLTPYTHRKAFKALQVTLTSATLTLGILSINNIINWNIHRTQLNTIEAKQHTAQTHLSKLQKPNLKFSPQQLITFQRFQDSQFPFESFFKTLSNTVPKFGKIQNVHLLPHKTKAQNFIVKITLTSKQPLSNVQQKLKQKFPTSLNISTLKNNPDQITLEFEGYTRAFSPK